MAHLSDDETVAKMGHPNLDVGHAATPEGVPFRNTIALCAMASGGYRWSFVQWLRW
jgi:hypothetical protein